MVIWYTKYWSKQKSGHIFEIYAKKYPKDNFSQNSRTIYNVKNGACILYTFNVFIWISGKPNKLENTT